MNKYIVTLTLFGIELEGNSRRELKENFISKFQNPSILMELFINNLHFIKENIDEAIIISEDGNSTNMQETAN